MECKKLREALRVLRVRPNGVADALRDPLIQIVRERLNWAWPKQVRGKHCHAPSPSLARGFGHADRNAEGCCHHALAGLTSLEETAVATDLGDPHALFLG